MIGRIFQLKDSEEFDWGLVWCSDVDFPDYEFTEKYRKYYNEGDEPGVDEFVEFLNKEFEDVTFERVYVEEINP